MSPGLSALASVGIGTQAAILLFLVAVLVFVVGFYWHVIVPGAIFVALVYLFMPSLGDDSPKISKVEKTQSVKIDDEQTEHKPTTLVEPKSNTSEEVVKIPVTKQTRAYNDFMADCTTIGDYSHKRCDDKWNNRDLPDEVKNTPKNQVEVKQDLVPISKVEEVTIESGNTAKPLDVSNLEYKQRRAQTLQNPNAVIMQATYR